jgi:hypothetical protein
MTKKLRLLLTIGITLASLTALHGQSFLTNGLVAYFPFNGNANDASGSGNNGLVTGGVTPTTDRFGNPNAAFLFNGSSGAIDVSSLNSFQYRPITYSAWVVVKTFFPFQTGHQFKSIIGRHQAGATSEGILGFYRDITAPTNYQNAFLMWRGGTSGLSPNLPSSRTMPPTNVWLHLVFTHESNGQWVFYQNGLQVSSGTISDVQNLTTGFRIGAGNSPELFAWDSKIDDVRLYNRVLTAAEVSRLYSVEAGILSVGRAVYLEHTGLSVGSNYQLQISSDLAGWTNFGAPFTATNAYWRLTNYWDVDRWNQLNFRLIAQ